MTNIATLTMNPSIDHFIEVEELKLKRKLRSSTNRYELGGGGINVARAILRHSHSGNVQALFPVGGANGTKLTELIEREEIPHHSIPIDAETRENFIVYVSTLDELYHFVAPGPQLGPEDAQRCLDALQQIQTPSLYLVASGSLPPGIDDEFYARVAHLAHRRDWRLILDTSGEPLKAALKESVFLIKPNIAEFAELAGTELSKDTTERLAQTKQLAQHCHAEVLIVTLDNEGALLTTREQQIWARPPPVTSLNPVGAGDSFVALLTLKLAQQRELKEALCYGVAAATAAVMTRGTELYHIKDVERLYNQMISDEKNIQIF